MRKIVGLKTMFAATATASTAAAVATRFSARASGVSGGKSGAVFRSAAARIPASHASARQLVECNINNNNNDWPAPAQPPPPQQGGGDSTSLQARGGGGGGQLDRERRNLTQRYAEIANIDPNDPRALDLIGSKTPCRVQFNVPYDTQMGEEVMIIGSHASLGSWNQNNAAPMQWTEGGVWRANVELPAGGVFFYKYVVKTLDQGFKWQEGANNLLVLPEPWDIPEGSVFMVDDNFSGLSRSSQNQVKKNTSDDIQQTFLLSYPYVFFKYFIFSFLRVFLLTTARNDDTHA